MQKEKPGVGVDVSQQIQPHVSNIRVMQMDDVPFVATENKVEAEPDE